MEDYRPTTPVVDHLREEAEIPHRGAVEPREAGVEMRQPEAADRHQVAAEPLHQEMAAHHRMEAAAAQADRSCSSPAGSPPLGPPRPGKASWDISGDRGSRGRDEKCARGWVPHEEADHPCPLSRSGYDVGEVWRAKSRRFDP